MEILHLEHPFLVDYLKAEPCVMALGFFDGVHLGHKQIIQTARDIAKKKNLKFSVMTFYPHPREVINKNANSVDYLSPLPVKNELFANMGVERLYVVKFDINFSLLSSIDFVKQYILGVHCKHVVAGFDFTYGYKGEGNMDKLKEEGRGKFEVTTIAKIEHHNQKISSTIIRQFISSGNVGVVPEYLGDFYEIRGRVMKIPRSYPLDDGVMVKIYVDRDYMLPRSGMYKIQAQIENEYYDGICYQKLKTKAELEFIEVKLFDYPKNFCNKNVKLKWLHRIT
ncbi:riboflavin kinase [Ammoniphilus sp. YIM 78166]|uniref:riboflavin kinase n=1 Tax=Ammoniphilus sp. YIM 78166 TaxID=1644106 RepID=UPI00106F0BC5|nr:riboflavin kinase [Ammoniphilus sp. YIM 78166]